jgi:hypothetical protein
LVIRVFGPFRTPYSMFTAYKCVVDLVRDDGFRCYDSSRYFKGYQAGNANRISFLLLSTYSKDRLVGSRLVPGRILPLSQRRIISKAQNLPHIITTTMSQTNPFIHTFPQHIRFTPLFGDFYVDVG